MAAGMGEQIERRVTHDMVSHRHPWALVRRSGAQTKASKARRERRRAKLDPECTPQYRRYEGWEW